MLLNYLSVFFGCLLLACLSLTQFVGEGGKGLIILCLAFIIPSFLQINKHDLQILKIKPDKIILGILLIICSAFISTISSYFLKESLLGFCKYFLYFLVFISFLINIHKNKMPGNYFIIASLISCIWVFIEGFKQFFYGAEALATWEDPNLHASEQLSRVYSTMLNPNLLSAYLLILYPLNFIFIQKLLLKKQYILTVLISLYSLALVFLIFQTGSRGAWLGLGIQVLFIGIYLLLLFRNIWIFGIFSLGILFSTLFLLSKANILNRILSIFSSYNHSSNSFRLHVWSACFKLISENMLLGIGVGSKVFYLGYSIYMSAKYSALGAYSLFIEIMVEMGLIGLICLLFIIWAIFSKVFSIIKTKQYQTEKFILAFSIGVGILGLLMQSTFDIVIFRPQVQIPLSLCLAILSYL